MHAGGGGQAGHAVVMHPNTETSNQPLTPPPLAECKQLILFIQCTHYSLPFTPFYRRWYGELARCALIVLIKWDRCARRPRRRMRPLQAVLAHTAIYLPSLPTPCKAAGYWKTGRPCPLPASNGNIFHWFGRAPGAGRQSKDLPQAAFYQQLVDCFQQSRMT